MVSWARHHFRGQVHVSVLVHVHVRLYFHAIKSWALARIWAWAWAWTQTQANMKENFLMTDVGRYDNGFVRHRNKL
jgi:hypothetical protein